MDVASLCVTVLMPVADIVRGYFKDIRTLKKLLKNDSDGAQFVGGLEKVLDGAKGQQLREDVSDLQKDLYLRLETTCTQLYQQIAAMRKEFQNRPCDLINPKYHRDLRKLQKSNAAFQSAVNHAMLSNNLLSSMEQIREKDDMSKLTKTLTEAISLNFRQLEDRLEAKSGKHVKPYQHRVQKTPAARPRRGSYQTRRALQRLIDRRQDEGRCRNCGRHRHWEDECMRSCSICNSTNHKATYCRQRFVC